MHININITYTSHHITSTSHPHHITSHTHHIHITSTSHHITYTSHPHHIIITSTSHHHHIRPSVTIAASSTFSQSNPNPNPNPLIETERAAREKRQGNRERAASGVPDRKLRDDDAEHTELERSLRGLGGTGETHISKDTNTRKHENPKVHRT